MRSVVTSKRRLLLWVAYESPVRSISIRTATCEPQRKLSQMNNEDREKTKEMLRKKMLDLRDVRIGPLPPDSPFVRPFRMHFLHDGKSKNWDLMRVHDSVALVVFNASRKKLIFVRQFRPAVYYACLPEVQDGFDVERYPASLGVTLELCAGIVDKKKPLLEIAREELLEECGYDAPASVFTEIVTCRAGVGTYGAKQTTYYAEVTDDMRLQSGGGVESEGELIEVVELSVPETKKYITGSDVQSPPGFLFGVYWFLHNKAQHC